MVTIMTVQEIAVPEVVSFDDLRSLASAKGPCITVVAPLPNPLEIRTRLKNAIREVEKKLAARGTDRDASAMLVEPLHRLAAEIEVEGKWANALILFCAPAVLRYFWLHESRKEAVTVADRFQIRPLLSWQPPQLAGKESAWNSATEPARLDAGRTTGPRARQSRY